MAKIRKIEITGLRGLRHTVTLDFGPTCQSMVIYGGNGRGKSSLVDALGCYFYHRIAYLERENVGRSAYRHRAWPDESSAEVRISFSEPNIGGCLSIDAAHHLDFASESEEAETFRRTAGLDRIILRHQELREFVDFTKTQKLEALGPFLGTKELSHARNEILTATGQLDRDLSLATAVQQESESEVSSLAKKLGAEDGDPWAAANATAELLGSQPGIGSLPQLQGFLNETGLSVDQELEASFREVTGLGVRLRGADSAIPDSLPAGSEFIEAFNLLTNDAQLLQSLSLANVSRAGLDVIQSSWWTEDICPLCDEPLGDPPALVSRIQDRLTAAADARQREGEVETRRQAARDIVLSVRLEIDNLLSSVGESAECAELGDLSISIRDALAALEVDLMTGIAAGRTLSSQSLDEAVGKLAAFKQGVKSSIASTEQRINELSEQGEERSRFEAYSNLSSLAAKLKRSEELRKRREYMEHQISAIRRVLEMLEALERETVSQILNELSHDVTRYYQRLHGSGNFSNIELEFLPDDRGLEFSLLAYGERASPPLRILSESQLSSLGLCLFLAAAKHFNTRAQFIVLDDIINSFDADHRIETGGHAGR